MNRYRAQLRTSLFFGPALLIVAALILVDRLPATGPVHAQASWRGLVVAPEQRCAPYDPDDYRYPQSVEDRIVAELGGVYAPYTGRWFASDTQTDIEHMVARSEAHDSGLCAADSATKRRFATDLLNLTLAGRRVNRYQKVAKDAAEWLPPQNRCWFAARVIAVRQQYGLTVDRREADALDRVLSGCASTEMVVFARGVVPVAGSSRSHLGGGPCGMGRQRQRAHQLRGGAGARDRSGDAGPSRVSVHAGRRRRRRGLRIRSQPYVLTASGGPPGAHPGCLWSVSQLHGAAARSSQRRSPRPLRVPTSHGP